MKSIQVTIQVTATVLFALLVASSAQARAIETTLQNSTSDTDTCKIVSIPEFGKKVLTNLPINLSKGLTADVYDTNTGLQEPSWFYVIKNKGKVTANIIVAYEGSNLPFGTKNERSWQPALGSCGGLKTQTVIVGTPSNVQIKKPLGSYIMLQSWSKLTTTTPNPKNITIK